MCNAFRPALVTSTDSDRGLGRRMMALAKSPNKLQDKVMKSGWNKTRLIRKTIHDTKLENFPELTEDELRLENFPELTEDELRDLKMGIYQLKQAKSYMDENFDEKGSYNIMAHKDDVVLKAQIIRIYYECGGAIEKSAPRITDWHHEACRVMTKGDREGRIFLSHPHIHDGYFFLLTTKYLIL